MTVPTGTTTVDLDAVGAGGGAGSSHIGGNAGAVTGTATLPTGTVYLKVIVGAGGAGDVYPAGSGALTGGGASAVMALDSAHGLLAKLVIAGGGGGGTARGNGGNAGSAGTSDNTSAAGPGQPGVGATGGARGTGTYVVGNAGESDSPTSQTVASGGVGVRVIVGQYSGTGGGGYGGGGSGGGAFGFGGNTLAGGGGGSSLASSALASAAVSVKSGSGGIEQAGVAGPGQAGTVSLTFNGLAVPDPPTAVSATAGNGQASVSFTAPASDGGSAITGYTVTSSPGGLTQSCTSSPCVVTGLTNGTAYTFTVHATNANGDSAESSPSTAVTPAVVPGAPTGVSATLGDHEASVSFVAPASDGGSSITSYTVTSAPGGVTATCPGSPCVIPGLTNGTAYTFTVHATNAIGDSAESSSSTAVTPAGVPAAPTAVSAEPGDQQVSVSFTAPAGNGRPITGYTVTSAPGGVTQSCASSPCVVTGLTNGTAYTFTVHATNAIGDSAESSPSTAVTPAVVPGAPTGVSATLGDHEASVSFVAPASDGGSSITSYTVTSAPGGVTQSCASSPCVVTGLTNGTAYTFTVHATNAIGDSAESSSSTAVTPAGVPSAPTAVSAEPGDQQVSVSFTAPASNGRPITGYTVTSAPGGVTQSCASSPCVVTGLTNGTAYTFTVHATNAIGDSAESSPSTAVTPAVVPGAPTGVSATLGDHEASVSFVAPASDGGSSITSYTVTSAPGGVTQSCASSPCVVTGLTNGTAYTFTVHATNAIGDSAESSSSTAVTPAGVPSAPTDVTLTPGDQQVSLSFPAPDDQGSPITAYQVSTDGGLTYTTVSTTVVNGQNTATVTGLTNGIEYSVRVRAVNAQGPGAPSTTGSTTPLTIPGIPTGVSAERGNDSAQITFTAPAGDGGSAITSYTVTSSPGGVTATCPGSPCVIAGLTNGTAYTFTVHATNDAGSSPESEASNAVTPATVPGIPRDLTAVGGDSQVTVQFNGPAADGGASITIYQYSLDSGATWQELDTTGTAPVTGTITGLTNGTSYPVQVRALNTTGAGLATTEVLATPSTSPGAPTGVSAVPGPGQATISFTPPASDGGAPIASYTLTSEPGGITATCTDSPCVITGLTNGTAYTFTVHATNSAGDSAESTASTAVVPLSPPSAPSSVTETSSTTTVTLSFPEPDSGGDPITGYEYSIDGGNTWLTLDTTSAGSERNATITGLQSGTDYSILVRAVNTAGNGAASTPIVISTLPTAPAAPTATPGTASVVVDWTQSSTTAVNGYTVHADPGPATCTTAARTTTSCVIGATAGVSYTYTVIAHAPSADSAASPATPSAIAAAPAVPASAPTSAPETLTTTDGVPQTVEPGQQLSLVGAGFLSYSSATVVLYSSPTVVGKAVTSPQGVLRTAITIPSTLEAGTHNLVASGVDRAGTVRFIRMQFTLAAPSQVSANPTAGSLAFTGTPLWQLTVWAILLIAAGAFLLTRRRAWSHDQ